MPRSGRRASEQAANLPAGTHHPRPFGRRRLRSDRHGRAQGRLLGSGGSSHDYRHVLSHCRGGSLWAVAVGHVPGVVTRTRRGSSPRTAPN